MFEVRGLKLNFAHDLSKESQDFDSEVGEGYLAQFVSASAYVRSRGDCSLIPEIAISMWVVLM